MAKPVEFGSFYKLLREVIAGNQEKSKELDWLLAEYEHAKDAKSAYDELGQIFCHHGVMELYQYTAIEDIEYINTLNKSVWDYLERRMELDLSGYMVKSMIDHAKIHKLADKVSLKWDSTTEEIEQNMEELAKYVTEGIIELII